MEDTTVKPIIKKFGKKKVEERKVFPRGPSFYPTRDVTITTQTKKAPKVQKTPKLRASLTPGKVLIVLAGRFKGKRVVFLKQLTSGLLLITGPFKLNGVPLRRINQAYVIATSTSVDVSGVKVDDKFNDAYFSKPKEKKKAKSEAEFFAKGGEQEKKKETNPQRSADQKAFDAPILAIIQKDKLLRGYLRSVFSLRHGDKPHAMKF